MLALSWILAPALVHGAERPFQPDKHTVFLLEPNREKKALVDTMDGPAPGGPGELVADERFGSIWKLGAAGITLRDEGRFRFDGGMTLDAWVRFDTPPPDKGTSFALKVGSFSWDLGKAKLNTAWLNFPSEPILGVTPQQYDYYPVGVELINGWMNVPVGRWTRLTVSYDESLGVVTTLIDGVVDRRRYRYRGPQGLLCDGKHPLTLLRGLQDCEVAAIKLSVGRPEVTPPGMEAYLNALPYAGKVMITIDHIDQRLALPLEVTITAEKASGAAVTLQRDTFDSHVRHDLIFDAPTWTNSWHTYTVSATSKGQQVFSRTLRLASVKPAGRTLIHEDRTISRDGKKFFPVMIYHPMPEDFPLMAELGFNVVLNDFNLYRSHGQDRAAYLRGLTECLDAAEKNRLFMIAAANAPFGKLYTIAAAKSHAALLMWYGADEPWGDLTRLQESYNAIKMLDPDLPVLIVQNNYSRLQDTAPGADILATDPYPVPNVSMRAVVDATQTTLRTTGGRKPAWTVLPQYGAKIPTRGELRSMVWLAIASGATGIGIFAWDERAPDPQTKELKGWFTKDHPEQIEDLRAVLKELRAREPILISKDAASQPGLGAPVNPALHVLLKESDGRRYLIAANDSRREEENTVILDGAKDGVAPDLGGGAPLAIRNGLAPLKLPPLGVAIYELPR